MARSATDGCDQGPRGERQPREVARHRQRCCLFSVAVGGGEVAGRFQFVENGADRFFGEWRRLLGQHVGDLSFEVLEDLQAVDSRCVRGEECRFDRVQVGVDGGTSDGGR